MWLDAAILGPDFLPKPTECAIASHQVPICFTVSATVSMRWWCAYVVVFKELNPLNRESSGSDLMTVHSVPERLMNAFKPLIFKGFFVFDVP
jgi:hypothetical protein